MSTNPEEFVNLVCVLFRGEGETNPPVTLQMQANIRTAYSVLHYWSQLPGLKKDGSIDSEHLNNWVRSARLSLSDKGRAPIGDEQIGQILASSPHGEDGIWPCEPVRELIEAIGNVNIDTGVYIGKVNQEVLPLEESSQEDNRSEIWKPSIKKWRLPLRLLLHALLEYWVDWQRITSPKPE
ncbi:MAG: hypothetical protein WDO06_08000 [Actinomycetota bacterium]